MIPLTFLYDEYIDRPKLTEQKKNPFEYIVPPPPPPQVGRNNNGYPFAHMKCLQSKIAQLILTLLHYEISGIRKL